STHDTLIYELGNMFAARLGLEELIPLVISKCREVLDAGGVSVLLLDGECDELSSHTGEQVNLKLGVLLVNLMDARDENFVGNCLGNGKADSAKPHACRGLRRGAQRSSRQFPSPRIRRLSPAPREESGLLPGGGAEVSRLASPRAQPYSSSGIRLDRCSTEEGNSRGGCWLRLGVSRSNNCVGRRLVLRATTSRRSSPYSRGPSAVEQRLH